MTTIMNARIANWFLVLCESIHRTAVEEGDNVSPECWKYIHVRFDEPRKSFDKNKYFAPRDVDYVMKLWNAFSKHYIEDGIDVDKAIPNNIIKDNARALLNKKMNDYPVDETLIPYMVPKDYVNDTNYVGVRVGKRWEVGYLHPFNYDSYEFRIRFGEQDMKGKCVVQLSYKPFITDVKNVNNKRVFILNPKKRKELIGRLTSYDEELTKQYLEVWHAFPARVEFVLYRYSYLFDPKQARMNFDDLYYKLKHGTDVNQLGGM